MSRGGQLVTEMMRKGASMVAWAGADGNDGVGVVW